MSVEPEMSEAESPSQRLARSLFGFGLLVALAGIIAWLGLLAAPVSPDAAYAQLRTVILVGFGALVVMLIGLTVWFLVADETHLHHVAALVARLFGRGWAAVIVGLTVVELNLITLLGLRDVAPAIVAPLQLALMGGSLVLLLVLATLHWESIQRFFQRTASTWAAIGFMVVAVMGLAGLFALTGIMIQISGVNNVLRGGLDYRQLEFIDDGDAPTSAQFFQEQAQTRVRWEPYVYWVLDEFTGRYINVAANGLRDTYLPATTPADAPLVAVFGGSTAWGEGSRDRYTIPSQIAELLNENGQPMRVVNYAQTGYVSTQDLLMFQSQLLQGQPIQVAVFYGGFNDILSAYTQNISGVALQETQRLSDSEAGRLLRAGQPLLRPLADRPLGDMSLMALADNTPQSIVSRYLANASMINALGKAYGVRVLFVWQPSIVFKQTLIGGETGAHQRMETERSGFSELYTQVDILLREALTTRDDLPSFILLNDLFRDDSRAIFYDLIHITEKGNRTVAESMAEAIADLFP